MIGVEVGVVYPHGPADASELVGKRDGGFVVSDTLFELQGPLMQSGGGLVRFSELLSPSEDGASAMDDEGTQIFIALL